MSKINNLYHKTVLYFVLTIIALPVISTFVYSISTKWGATILPDGFTFAWYMQLFGDARFWMSFIRSMIVSIGALILCLMTLLPIIFIAYHRIPSLLSYMNLIVLLPFTIPPVVSSVGLLQLYSGSNLHISLVLIGTYFTMIVPFVYRAVANSMNAINVRDLVDSARMLGASTIEAFFLVVLPNIKRGIFIGFFISLSVLLGEFVFANILVGTRYETLQVYLYGQRIKSGHFTSALVITYFAMIFIITVISSKIGHKK